MASHHRKAAAALAWNVSDLAGRYGIERLGFLTLTFADHVLDPREAQRRFNSLATHVLKQRYAAWLRVFERQKSGRIHYHLLVVLEGDIRTGCDFDAFARRSYSSAGSTLRAEWAFWRRTAARYRFGRTELLPIRSSVEAASRYVGKYIGKHVDARQEADKGVRLVAYSRGACMASTRFTWVEGGRAWRAGVAALAEGVARSRGWPLSSLRDGRGLIKLLGPKWAFTWRDTIQALGEAAQRAPAPSGAALPEIRPSEKPQEARSPVDPTCTIIENCCTNTQLTQINECGTLVRKCIETDGV